MVLEGEEKGGSILHDSQTLRKVGKGWSGGIRVHSTNINQRPAHDFTDAAVKGSGAVIRGFVGQSLSLPEVSDILGSDGPGVMYPISKC